MTATQEHLFKLLLEIDEICKRHDIEFFLAYGTILGAIRHEGFIPWDNDLDIAMTEENYDKFVEVCKSDLDPQKRAFCDARTNREFPTVFGHYIDLECCRMSKKTVFWDELCGQCIDVFCMMELPGNKEEKQKAINRYFAYDEYVNSSFMHYRYKTDAVYDLYMQYQKREAEIGREKVLQELEAQIFGKHYDDCDMYMISSARMADPPPFVPKRAYDTPCEVLFEGHPFKVPGDYVDIMTRYYGDGFNLFPSSVRVHSEMSHTGIPSRAYVDDFMRLLDKNDLLQERYGFKKMQMTEARRGTMLIRDYYRAIGFWVKRDLEQKLERENIDVKEIIEHGKQEDLQRLEKVFGLYFDKQLHTSMFYWRIHFDIGDELEYAAMYLLLMVRNNLTGIVKLLICREQNGLEITDKMLFLKKLVQLLRNTRKYLIYGEYEKARTELDEIRPYLPEHKLVRILEMKLSVETAATESDYQKCAVLIDEMTRLYPKEDACKKARGDILWKQGLFDEATEIYSSLEKNTNDGLILLDIKNKTY